MVPAQHSFGKEKTDGRLDRLQIHNDRANAFVEFVDRQFGHR